ncbi:Myotubularin-related protein 2 [Phytophthora citrophthora]|uniref:phosphatidylinositol-3,5-bisphosphate 3-phosphatase n=1 Tax=Phytophthora citrophthora TaxID=4793 RepID=A0AAD9GUA8_9STRA|nr:Myotubularin-related protein 2 [Phytophthora citrophthora]
MLASAKSMDDEAARLAVLRDPKRMAALLVRAFSSSMLEEPRNGSEEDEMVEETQEEFLELERRASAGTATEAAPLRVVIRPAAEDDEDDAEEEEEVDEQEEEAGKPLDEEELEAAATALQTATRIVEELRLKMMLKAGEQMERQKQDTDNEPPFSTTGSLITTPPRPENSPSATGGGPGVPVPRARVRSNSTCSGCSKSFNPFHRSKNCAACGYAFCPKCSSKNIVLPTCFGYRDEAVRTCDPCARWFQKAMDRYFDAMELTKEQDQESTVHRGSMGEVMIEEKSLSLSNFGNNNITVPSSSASDGVLSVITRPRSSVSSPDPVPSCPSEEVTEESPDHDEQITTSSSTTSKSRRRHRHSSISVSPSPSIHKNKPWFSGHLRAMHVNDRLPRKKKGRGESEGGDTENNSPELRSFTARRSRLSSVASSTSKRKYTIEDTGEKADGQSNTDDTEDLTGASANTGQEPSTDDAKDNSSSRPRRKTRRSKFSRSASFDLTNLPSAASPNSSDGSPDLKRCNTFGPDEARAIAADIASNGSGRSNSMKSLKAFDDSDIVDERALPDSADVKMKSEAKLSAAVLRFAVYEMGAKEGAGLRRTFGFTKANPVLDRYTLELDCRQRIVRAKSVFMHRFWSFHCDSVQSFEFGSSEGVARLIVFNGGQGNQSLELKFANDDEREQFKQAMDSCRSSHLDRMRGFASRTAMSLPARPEVTVSPVPDTLRSPTLQEPNTTFSADMLTSIESELKLTHDTGDTCDIDSPTLQSIHVPLLPGEIVVKDTELEATLLIGPASDTYESAQLWGRIRGKIAVTNYRVIFTPFDRVQIQPRCGGQGGIAYIPLFAITQVQLLYPGGRRTKSGRTYYAGMTGSASIVSINCKDIRVMRFQLDTHPSVSDDRTHKLRATIAKMADSSQRYTVVERGSPIRTSSPGLGPLPKDTPDQGDSGQSSLQESREPSSHFTHSSSRIPAYAASPVLRPDRILTLPHEISGSFAFSYSISDIPPDQNGWNLFVDEREFKRQIGGDPAVSPFLKFYKNDRGNICKSYPSKLLLPASMNSSTLAKVADFRAKNRLPVITYYHRRNRCVLTRSSQPLLGSLLSGSSNVSDQLLLGVYRRLPDIIKNQSQSSQSSRPIYIFDARKPKASTGNRLMGKGGVETPQDYPGAVIHHLNIANMYRMQSSFMGLMKLFLPGGIEDTDRTWLSSVESTRWLDHVRLVLDGALKIARVLELEGASALVHCSDGWDRTAQLCALAQLMIDPYFRTIRGFATLVEKDWLAFGHKFAERTSGDRNRDPQRNKASPIMFQFIDAVWQMQRQYPRSFEFNERFLLHLANSMTSGLYGTFLYDSRLQRDVNEVKYNSVSVWTPVLLRPELYSNSDYEMHNGPIWPWVSCKMLRLWDNYFFQWHPKFYKVQWACSLIYHGPSARGSTSTTDDGDKEAKDIQQRQTPHSDAIHMKDPPALDLLATPITSTIDEYDGEHVVPTISLSSDDEDSSKRIRTASGTYTKKSSKRNLFGLTRGSRQRAQSEENGSQEIR